MIRTDMSDLFHLERNKTDCDMVVSGPPATDRDSKMPSRTHSGVTDQTLFPFFRNSLVSLIIRRETKLFWNTMSQNISDTKINCFNVTLKS